MWFFCGENVVDCVVNVVKFPSLFGGEKIGQVFQLYFREEGGKRREARNS